MSFRDTASYRDNLPFAGPSNSHATYYVACWIAKNFTKAAPTVESLQSQIGMSRSQAYRWVRAWKDATGQA